MVSEPQLTISPMPLQQGERLALESDDVDGWIRKFSAFQIVQLIDLDAAMGRPATRRPGG